jgi:hypothetical protein
VTNCVCHARPFVTDSPHGSDLRADWLFDVNAREPAPICSVGHGMRWQWKVFIPILAVLILSVVTIYAVLRSLDIHETQSILVA